MRIGIDLGGTKIEGIALDEAGAVRARRRVATPRDQYEGTVEAIAGLVEALEAEVGARATVGVGMPGAISPASGLVKNANSTWLIGRPLDRDLAARLGRPVRLANDANCFALSEAVDGAAAGARVVFGVIVGTGTGGGVVVDRKVLTGPNAIAGEWGHNPLPWPSADGVAGARRATAARPAASRRSSRDPASPATTARRPGRRVPGPEVVARAERGETAADAALARYESRMARALAVVLNVLDPDVIVLGGGVSKVARLYENVPRLWQEWAFSDRVDTVLRRPVHGDASGVRGAAWLWGPGEEG